ncbi:MAG: flavin reductase family protein [Desulfurococcales archaeon]|nr:flavin reductase family protein [Desulfurococcales archaeon]
MDAGELLKAFMRNVAQPVFAVTARSNKGYAAFTASSVTSISLEPPLMMVSVAKGSRSHDPLIEAKYFIITLLSYDDREVAEVLAEREDPKNKLERVGFKDTPYGPQVRGKAHLYLSKWRTYDGGDHTIVLGKVEGGSIEVDKVEKPLVYHYRRYTTVL